MQRRIEFQPEPDRSRLETVVQERIRRFAFRERLQFSWQHSESEVSSPAAGR